MQSGQLLNLLDCQAFEACICGMSSHRQIGLFEPTPQGFRINTQQRTTISEGNGRHEDNSFRRKNK
jgi:hypothetical protein